MEQHKLRVHTGRGLNQRPLTIPTDTVDLDTPILPPTGHYETDEYRSALDEHADTIRSQTTNGSEGKKVNVEIPPTYSYRELKALLDEVRREEHGAFKINLGFASMLFDTVNQVYRYFYVSHNHYLFDRAFTISTNRDMTTFFDKILSLQLTDKYYFQRPSSGWVLAGLPNLEIRVMRLRNVPIGSGVQLPAHVKNSRSIIGLTRDNTNRHDFNDNLCLFRCLALHFGAKIHALEGAAKYYKNKLEEYADECFDDGVEVSMMATVETCFNIAINIYSLQEDKTAKTISISTLNYKQDDVMHLNVYENHFSYIKKGKFRNYAKKFTCTNCTRILNDIHNLNRHVKKCRAEVQEVFKGGKYKNRKTVFELLDTLGINVPQSDRFDPYFAVYDFEALQVRIEEVLQGRKLKYKHVPATVSICSNVPNHTEPLHLRSNGDSQQLIDQFVIELLKIQATRETLLTEKYQPFLDALEIRKVEIEAKLRGLFGGVEQSERMEEDEEEERQDDGEEREEEEEEKEEVDDVQIGQKRKRKGTRKNKQRVSKRTTTFLDDEAELSGGGDDDDADGDSDDEDIESDLEGLIDDSSDVEEDNASYYRAFDNTTESQPGPSSTSAPPQPPSNNDLTDEQYEVETKRLKKVKAFLSKLKTYIGQITILGFNSQNYDIPLIRPYLPSAIIKHDGTPKQIIKKMSGYMVISSEKMKFLDITNYLAAGTSLKDFYKSNNVSTPKGCFPYAWFDSLKKLEATSLPTDIEAFHSILTKKTITVEEFRACHNVWRREEMTTFADFVRYYNNADVIGFVEAVDKMITNERENNELDMFKESVSLPGLTQKYLFKRLSPESGEYFVGFAEEHKRLAKLMRENITGGPSIIFHRNQERDVTLIKGKYPCRKVIGYDANSLYLYCLGLSMPTGYYTLQEEKNNYKKETRYSRESIQWLEYVMRTQEGVHNIRHAENGGEVRIGNIEVDGYDESTRTVYEYHGCFWHGHFCHTGYNPELWKKTLDREQYIRDLGYNLVSTTSCEWLKCPESKEWYSIPDNNQDSSPSPLHPPISMEDILDDIVNDRLFGFVKVDIHVPSELVSRLSDFPPIFKNTEITMADIGDHMQAYCRSIARKKAVARSLISSMHAKGILLLTPLLKKYLAMGLKVTRLELVIGYNGAPVFDWFVNEVVRDRRLADLGGAEFKMKGEASKLKGNCGYGRTLMDKSKHTKLSFAKRENLPNHVNNPFLKMYDELNEHIFEVEKKHKKIVHDLPVQIGLAVYSYAKLRMLEFWEFINTFLVNDLYQLMEMDTDSLYIAFARDTIDDCVRPELRAKWVVEKRKWFSSDHNFEILFEGYTIPYSQWDKRTPGKFKPEFDGDGMVCLNSKVYHIWSSSRKDDDGKYITKTSCKGAQQKRNTLLKEHFVNVLDTQKQHFVKNAGFVKDKEGIIKTYTQKKVGMGYFYAKREVLEDGVTTIHLDI